MRKFRKHMEFIKSAARVVTNAGMSLVGTILEKAGFREACNQLPVALDHPKSQIECSDILGAAIGVMCSGNVAYEAVTEFKDDQDFYCDALGLERVASPERFRQRLDQIAAESEEGLGYHDQLRALNISVLKSNKASITPLSNGFVPVDGDVTPYDESKSHKEKVSRTYKGCDGYAPMMFYIGLEGYCINTEMREGKQHSQKGTPDLLVETVDLCHQMTDKPLLFRLDSGNDAAVNLGLLMNRGEFFIVKRNPRKESKEEWLEEAKKYAPSQEKVREGKTVYVGSTWKEITIRGADGPDFQKTLRIVYEVTERTIDKYGQILCPSDIEVNTWWTNTGLSDKEVIMLYHEHGTMEQFHSELKTDMNTEKLPSGKFATNELILDLSMIAYNVLRLMSMLLCKAPDSPMKKEAFRRRLSTVILNIIHAPARIVRHARSITMDLGGSNVWADTIIWLGKELSMT